MKLLKVLQRFWERIFDSSTNYCKLSGFSYYAFISYTEKDEKWAEWLQWNLEHYKIPTKVRNENKELPRKIRPVFWYKNDLAGAHLSGAIKKELEQSKYMIVVCSPTSAKKEWVNDEVQYFKNDLGRGDKIIPFIVDGKMNADDIEQECLPLPIRNLPREKELRCIDVREYGKNKALVNIVSTLFDIRFDILWNRFKREQRRRFAIYSVCSVLFGIILFGCWDYFLHTKYEYYVDIEDCNGTPTGIIKISNDEADEHYRLYRFEYRRRMLQRVVYVDCDGNPQNHTNTEFADRPCIQELSYSNGDLSLINCKDASNKTLYIMHLSKDKLAADLKDDEENQAANFIFSSSSVDQGQSEFFQSPFLDRILKSPSKIARYIYERDDDGYLTKKMFARHNGDNDDIGVDANGISGFEYERDSLHRVVRIRFLDAHGKYKANRKGVAGKKYEYDKNGNITIVEYVDKDDHLKYNELHWAKCIDTYDDKGYPIDESVYGIDGKPCVSGFGYHILHMTYNKNVETISFYDIHNKPTYTLTIGDSPGGFSIITNIKNEKGQVVETQYKDSNGNPCYNHHHVATLKIEYSSSGLVTGLRNYGIDNKPCTNIDGYHYARASYNKQGHLTEQSFFNINGMPTHNSGGFHRANIMYDGSGHRAIEMHVFNLDNLPTFSPLFNDASWIKLGYNGSSKWVSEISFYSYDNKPIETTVGAKVCCERDPYGQITAYNYYNENDELSSDINHCAIMELAYNDMGMETERRFYDENKTPMMHYGIFRISRSYTKTGQLERICFYDTLGHTRNCPDGWAIQEFSYNEGAQSANSYFGEESERVEVQGVHRYEYEIDDYGNVLSQSAFDKDMQPTMNILLSAHKLVHLYDENRRIIGRDLYNTNDIKPFVSIRYKLNQRGLLTEQTAYNAEMELVESPFNYGVAKIQSKYDSQDRITYMCATDKSGKKMNTSYGIAESFYEYGSNIFENVNLDSQKKLANNLSVQNPYAYSIIYMTDTGQRLFSKNLIINGNHIDTIREANYYIARGQHIQKAIRCEEEQVKTYDLSTNQMSIYYSFEEEYNKYVHIVDSIQHNVEKKYGKPKLYHYVTEFK